MSEKKDLKEQLEAFRDQLKSLSKEFKQEEKRSLADLYFGIIMGMLGGILGNYFVSLYFQPTNLWNIRGLILSFILIVILCTILVVMMVKNLR